MLTIFLLVGLFIIFNAIYFVPTIFVFNRSHRNRWVIFAINFIFGFTGIVWILLLIWALDKFDVPNVKS
jgi:Na+/proline symporter